MIRGVALVAFVLAGCASPDGENASGETAPTTTTVAPATATTTSMPPPSRDPLPLKVTLADYEIRPATTIVPAGAYQLAVTNTDRAPHDVVLLQTTLALDDLPTTGIRVDEHDRRLDLRARTATIEPGGSGSLVATLRPGTYVLVCTVPHHYVRDRMAIELTVAAPA